ncbi:Subtilisin-like protease SBT1-3 [Nymphaea thermarum]|nr:Subtilisin-like protease SBT1-3 [Nymphaea thermarum]
MGIPGARWLWLNLAFFFYLTTVSSSISTYDTPWKTFVIHTDKSQLPEGFATHLDWYSYTLDSIVDEPGLENGNERIIYDYQNAFHGFAARLTEEEAVRLGDQRGVLAVFPETVYHLHTTRSPEFLGLDPGLRGSRDIWSSLKSRRDVIIGVLDTGIWPESQSFNDSGLAARPARWKGACETGRGFTTSHCNQKIIGARIFFSGYEAGTGIINERDEYKSPRDQDGHGTHTAATVAGVPVPGANLLGYASGTARGMAPRARLAVYKVCWTSGCFSSDILSAIDQAVADGVDVLSISLGGSVSAYYRDTLSIAAFGAMEKGVFVSCSAGNGGPGASSLTNVSPWIATIGASTMDRDFPSHVKLGDGRIFSGVSLYKGRRVLSLDKQYPLVYMGNNMSSPLPSALCMTGSLDPRIVAGKIVLCDRGINPRVEKGQVVKEAGGIGMILANTDANGEELVADSHLLPATAVGAALGKEIRRYMQTSPRPTATLSFSGTNLGIRPSPVVAAFSSRGPNTLTPEVLKPDMIAPGVNILAAWSEQAPPTSLAQDRRRVKFNILSGTSMSCPHVSGIAALLKSVHPEWSPAAIKSALMTTAYIHDSTHNPFRDAASNSPSNPYQHGAGHINPSKALDPGLLYDISPQDYFDFLCSIKLTPAELRMFAKSSNLSCHHGRKSPADLNYPAISVVLTEPPAPSVLTVQRTVTNVGNPNSRYYVAVAPIKGVTVKVAPKTLVFTKKYQKLSYEVTFTTTAQQPAPQFGALIWSDGVHDVRSPVIVSWMPPL